MRILDLVSLGVKINLANRLFDYDRLYTCFSGLGARKVRYCFLAGILLATFGNLSYAQAQDNELEEFPRILTLSAALDMLDTSNPELMLAEANIASVAADRMAVKSLRALNASMGFEFREVDRIGVPGHDYINDSRALLILDKQLSTFGRDAKLSASIDTEIESLQFQKIADMARVRNSAIKAFFDVIVSDYAYAYIAEEMTLSFLAFDDAQEEMERFQERPEVEVRALESVYLEDFSRRTAAEHDQRASRLRLALALNRPNAHPNQLVEPDLSVYDREIPDYDDLLGQILENSPTLQSAQIQLEADKQKLAHISLHNRPIFGARFQAAEFRQSSANSRDQFRASVYLDIPLNTRKQRAGEASRQQAVILQQEAEIAVLENQIRENVLALVQQLSLLDTKITAAKTELLYRDLELDRVRLQYEMEIRARIGTANADVARALHRLMSVQYQRALVWEQIDALTGQDPVAF